MRERRDIHRDDPDWLGDVEPQGHPDDPEPLFERLAEVDRPSRRLRARVRLRRRALDSQLAEGVSPLDDAALALRARQLVCGQTREQFAAGLEGLVRHAERPPLPRCFVAVPLPRRQILEARPGLLALATCLRADRPLYARGMALLSWLLSDGTGPACRLRSGMDPVRPGRGAGRTAGLGNRRSGDARRYPWSAAQRRPHHEIRDRHHDTHRPGHRPRPRRR
jgi:hypothetical protein